MLLMLCAAVFLLLTGVQLWKSPQAYPEVKHSLKSPLETFLCIQTIFGSKSRHYRLPCITSLLTSLACAFSILIYCYIYYKA